METPTVRLYVNSYKRAAGTEDIVIDKPTVQILSSDPRVALPPRVYSTRETRTVTKYEHVLPENQRSIVEIAREPAAKHGFNLDVIDVAQLDFLSEDVPKAVKRLGNFPVLATKSQTQLAVSKEDVEQFFSREIKTRDDESKPE